MLLGEQPNFSDYIVRLRSVVRKRCPTCHTEVCLACGEPVSGEKERTTSSNDPLFHCSDLQGIILGMGLLMLEQTFQAQQNDTPAEPSEKVSKANKRRKTDNSSGESDSVGFLGFVGVSSSSSKKAKGGIGYAGDQKEDVSINEEIAIWDI